MQQIGLDLLYSSKQIEWGSICIEMFRKQCWNKKNIFHEFDNGCGKKENFILEANYLRAHLLHVSNNQEHLSKT